MQHDPAIFPGPRLGQSRDKKRGKNNESEASLVRGCYSGKDSLDYGVCLFSHG